MEQLLKGKFGTLLIIGYATLCSFCFNVSKQDEAENLVENYLSKVAGKDFDILKFYKLVETHNDSISNPNEWYQLTALIKIDQMQAKYSFGLDSSLTTVVSRVQLNSQ